MDKLIILSGNPNVGKSSIFNTLTGMHQHTGNWSGKTVSVASGKLKTNKEYQIIDLPGTYSMMYSSEEEKIARDIILFEKYDKNIVVIDSCFLERNLNLLLQILEINKNVIVCLNLNDLAKKNNIFIDDKKLEEILGLKVIKISAKNKKDVFKLIKLNLEKEKEEFLKIDYGNLNKTIDELEEIIKKNILFKNINTRFISIKLLEGDKTIIESIKQKYKVNILTEEVNSYLRNVNTEEVINIVNTKTNKMSEEITKQVMKKEEKKNNSKTLKFDKLITSKLLGLPFMFLILLLIFYITIVLANYPSELLSNLFNNIEEILLNFCYQNKISQFIYEPLILGVYKTLTWVVSVMLPPMCIFFPLFSLAEESGLLPRIAFNFDKIFKKCEASGKQVLTMMMGFGCNAVAIIGARIIDSPRDKLLAILTNSFIPCNGRFPLLIVIISMFFVTTSTIFGSFLASLVLTLLILFGVVASLIVSKILSRTLLKGIPSFFTLELPPYRKPKVFIVIIRSIIDKALFVLLRAIKVAAPAGLVIWLMANINVNNISLLNYISEFLDPFASIIGLDGFILFAFILAFPANEIVLPIILMCYLGSSNMLEIQNLDSLKTLLINNGWNIMTALSVCIFSIMHFPCATTFLTIKKEVGLKWALLSILIPTITGIIVLFIINRLYILI